MPHAPGASRSLDPGRIAFVLALTLLALFAGGVVLGKLAIRLGWQTVFQAGDVAQFLLVLGAVVCFVIGILIREAQAATRPTEITTTGGNHDAS